MTAAQDRLPPSVTTQLLVERKLPPLDADSAIVIRLVTDDFSLESPSPPHAAGGDVLTTLVSSLTTLVSRLVAKDKPLVWLLNFPHPLAPEAKILRMYAVENELGNVDGIDIYSSNGQMYVRTYIPMSRIKFFDSTQSEDLFVEQIHRAESDDDETTSPETPEHAPAATASPNGQPS